MRLALLALLLAAATPALAQPLDLSKVDGAYRQRFANQMVSGERYTSENILEVLRLSPDTAYIRTRLEFANGHQCNLAAIARVEGDALVYRRPANVSSTPGGCTLRLRFGNGQVSFADEAGRCRADDCGARGDYEGAMLPLASRRAITYGDRIRASSEFRDAQQEFAKAGR